MHPSRILSQQAKKMVEWLAIVYDKPGADRLAYRAQHLKDIPASLANGSVVSAGAIFNEVPQEGQKIDFAGSVVNVIADSKEEVLEILAKDIYAREGVWDLNNVLIYPCGIAARVAKELPTA